MLRRGTQPRELSKARELLDGFGHNVEGMWRGKSILAAGMVAAACCLLRAAHGFDVTTSGGMARRAGQGHWRWAHTDEDVPPCGAPDVFTFKNSTLSSSKWHFSLTKPRDITCVRKYEAADPEHPECPMVKLRPAQIQQCLAGRHIVMIGDSLTRCVQ